MSMDFEARDTANAAYVGALGALRLGAVSSKFILPSAINPANQSQMIRNGDFARDTISVGYLVFPNFYVSATSGGIDTAPGATRTINASIEYPAGVMHQVTFGGSATGTMTDGQARMVSDPIAVSIPRGAQFWINVRQASTAGIIYANSRTGYPGFGDQEINSSGLNVADNTMVPGWTGAAGGATYRPLFVAMTRRPTVAVIGDSRVEGAANTSGAVPYPGEVMPGIGPLFGCINLARGGCTIQTAVTGTNSAKRREYLAYATHGVMQLGINDISSARTAAQIRADRASFRAYAPTLTWIETTIPPKTSSTDSWATLTNQTLDTNNSVRVTLNNLIRGGDAGVAGLFDIADAMESSRNSGKWKAPPLVDAAITADGLHQNDAGCALAVPFIPAGVINNR